MRMGYIGAVLAAIVAVPSWAASSADLDLAFNAGGSVDLSGSGFTTPHRLDVTAAGVSTVSGQCGANYCLARFLANGTADTTFGTNGVLTVAAVAGGQGFAIFPTTDDKYWLIGNKGASGQKLFIARIMPNGSLDNTFDTDGVADLVLAGHEITGQHALIDSIGRIYITGYARLRDTDTRDSLFLTRLNSSGAVDVAFYGSGKRFIELSHGGSPFNPVLDQFSFSPNGALLIAAHSSDLSDNVGTVLRLNQNGSFDSSFNSTGMRSVSVTNADISRVYVNAHSDSRVALVADVLTDAAVKQTAMQVYKLDGSFDTTFSTDGFELSQPGGKALHNHLIKWLPEGRFLLAGFDDSNQIVLTRLAVDGTIANTGADQWTSTTSTSLNMLVVLSGGQWLAAGDSLMWRLVGDDRTPNAFSIAAQNDRSVGSIAVSEPITIAGLDQIALVSFDGTGGFNLTTNSKCTSGASYAGSGTVKNGDVMCIRMRTATEYDTEATLKVFVGDYSTDFVTKTKKKPKKDSGGGGGAFWPFALIALLFARRFKR